MSIFERFQKWLTPQPSKIYLHVGLGSFTSDDDVWTTKVQHGAENFRLSLAGSDSQPNEPLLNAAVTLLAKFGDVRHSALLFLATEEPESPIQELTCYGLDLLWPEQPGDFTLEFIHPNDEDDVWRVQFLSGSPKYVGHDS